MAMIPDDELDKIKRTTDLAAVIRARGVELKSSGGDLVGRCPFHDDHNPSMGVFIVFGSIVVATAAAMFEQVLQNALKRSESSRG